MDNQKDINKEVLKSDEEKVEDLAKDAEDLEKAVEKDIKDKVEKAEEVNDAKAEPIKSDIVASKKEFKDEQKRDKEVVPGLEKAELEEGLNEAKKTLDDVYEDPSLESIWETKWKELVPTKGKAETPIGEVMRCFAKVSHEYFQNGSILGKGWNNKSNYDAANDMDRALQANGLNDNELCKLWDKIWATRSEAAYDHYLAEFYEKFINKYLKNDATSDKEFKEEQEREDAEFPEVKESELEEGLFDKFKNITKNADFARRLVAREGQYKAQIILDKLTELTNSGRKEDVQKIVSNYTDFDKNMRYFGELGQASFNDSVLPSADPEEIVNDFIKTFGQKQEVKPFTEKLELNEAEDYESSDDLDEGIFGPKITSCLVYKGVGGLHCDYITDKGSRDDLKLKLKQVQDAGNYTNIQTMTYDSAKQLFKKSGKNIKQYLGKQLDGIADKAKAAQAKQDARDNADRDAAAKEGELQRKYAAQQKADREASRRAEKQSVDRYTSGLVARDKARNPGYQSSGFHWAESLKEDSNKAGKTYVVNFENIRGESDSRLVNASSKKEAANKVKAAFGDNYKKLEWVGEYDPDEDEDGPEDIWLEESKDEPLKEAVSQDLINAIMWFNGCSKTAAIKQARSMDEERKKALIDAFKSNAKKSFYSESLKETLENGTLDTRETEILDKAISTVRYNYLGGDDKAFVNIAINDWGMTPKELDIFCGVDANNTNESLKEDLTDSSWGSDFRSDVYNALSKIAFKYYRKDINITDDDWNEAIEWFMTHFFEDEQIYEESLHEGRRIDFDDDIVKVYDGKKVIYHGLEDYEPMNNEPWVWNSKDGCYYLKTSGKTYKKVCEESLKEAVSPDLINAIMWHYGCSKTEANKQAKGMSEERKKLLIQAFKDNAKKSFYNESLKEDVELWDSDRVVDLARYYVNKYPDALDEQIIKAIIKTMQKQGATLPGDLKEVEKVYYATIDEDNDYDMEYGEPYDESLDEAFSDLSPIAQKAIKALHQLERPRMDKYGNKYYAPLGYKGERNNPYLNKDYLGNSEIDWQKANFTKVSAEDALSLYKQDPRNILVVVGGRVILFDSEGNKIGRNEGVSHPVIKRDGSELRDTERMTIKQLLSIADEIYSTDYYKTLRDPEMLKDRGENPESPNYEGPSARELRRQVYAGETDYFGDPSESDKKNFYRKPNAWNWTKTNEDDLRRYKNALKDYEAELRDRSLSAARRSDIIYNIEWTEDKIKRLEKDKQRQKSLEQNYKATLRNTTQLKHIVDQRIELVNIKKEAEEAEKKLQAAQIELDNTKKGTYDYRSKKRALNDVESSISYYKNEIEKLIARAENYKKQIADIEASGANDKLTAEAQAKYDQIAQETSAAVERWAAIKNRLKQVTPTNESLEEANGTKCWAVFFDKDGQMCGERAFDITAPEAQAKVLSGDYKAPELAKSFDILSPSQLDMMSWASLKQHHAKYGKPVPVNQELEEDLTITKSFATYEPWGQAVDTFERIKKADKLEEAESILEELYPEGITETSLNDILAFEPEWLLNELGIADDEEKAMLEL